MKIEELRGQGVAEPELGAAASRAMGNELLARERSRDAWVWPWLQDVAMDVRFALRLLLKERRFALTAMLTLGLGIGVSNAAFSFINAAMFRDLPFDQPDRLITIRTEDVRGFNAGVSYLEFLEWQAHTTVFTSMTASLNQSVNLSEDDRGAERLSGTYITYPGFAMLGVTTAIGRAFVAGDDSDGAPPVVVFSHSLWQSRYGGDPGVLGRVVRISGLPATVIGVMPDGFQYPLVADLWLPMAMAPGIRNATWRSTGFDVVGRLRPDISLEQARSEIETVGARSLRDHPEINQDRRLLVMRVKDSQLGNGAAPLLWALFGGAVIVLLVACANVANLLLARAWSRSREIAVRVAIGAPRWRVVRQVLIECTLLGAGSTVLGAYLSYVAFQAMSNAFSIYEFGAPDRPRKPYWYDPSIDGVGLLFMAATFLFASVGAGLIPALHLSRADANDILKQGAAGQVPAASRRWATALMAAQIAVASMLLCAGGLFVRNLLSLYFTDPIVATENRVAVRLTLPQNYGSAADRLQFVRRLDERLAANSEFTLSTIGSDLPLQTLTALPRTVVLEGEVPDPARQPRTAVYIAAGPRFFDVLQLPVTRGRALGPDDALVGREGAVVNQRFAALFFGDAEPLGRRIRLSQPGPAPIPGPAWLTIVGITPTVPDFLPQRPDDAVVFAPLLSDPTPSRNLSVVVGSASKAAAVAALRHEVSALDGDLPIYAAQSLDEILSMTRMGTRMIGSWFQALAAVAVMLACVGLYALTSHNIAQRRKEIGIRMALGAKTGQVIWMFTTHTFVVLTSGLALGLVAALATTRLLTSFLQSVDPRDPLTFAIVPAVLSIVALASGALAVSRAARVDPVITLRGD
jgi:predicted permease